MVAGGFARDTRRHGVVGAASLGCRQGPQVEVARTAAPRVPVREHLQRDFGRALRIPGHPPASYPLLAPISAGARARASPLTHPHCRRWAWKSRSLRHAIRRPRRGNSSAPTTRSGTCFTAWRPWAAFSQPAMADRTATCIGRRVFATSARSRTTCRRSRRRTGSPAACLAKLFPRCGKRMAKAQRGVQPALAQAAWRATRISAPSWTASRHTWPAGPLAVSASRRCRTSTARFRVGVA